jgi:hypothetical protein
MLSRPVENRRVGLIVAFGLWERGHEDIAGVVVRLYVGNTTGRQTERSLRLGGQREGCHYLDRMYVRLRNGVHVLQVLNKYSLEEVTGSVDDGLSISTYHN